MPNATFLRLTFISFALAACSHFVYAQNTDSTVEKASNFSPYVKLSLNVDSTGQPIIINKDTAFTIYISTGALNPQQRAQIISERLNGIALKWDTETDSLGLIVSEEFVRIIHDSYTIMEVIAPEAQFENTTLIKLAKKRRKLITETLTNQLSGTQMWLQYGLAFLIIVANLFILNFILKRVFNQFKKQIRKRKSKYIRGIKIKDFEVMDAAEELQLVFKILFGIRIVFLLILASISFPIIFSFFPATEFIAYKLFGYVYNPVVNLGHSIINYLPNLFAILVIVYFVRFILKYLKMLSKRIEYGRIKIQGFYPDWARTTYEIIRILIVALALVMVFPYLPGAQSDVFKGVSVFIGIIFSIGSTSVVGNLVAGLVMTYMRPFTIGDRIKIGEIEGEIVEKTPFVLRIKTPKNEYITMPNSNVLSSHVVNYNQSFDEGGVILFTDITIGYNIPWRDVHELLLKAANATEYLEKDPAPFVLQNALEDNSVSYQINAYSKKPLYKDLIYSLLHQNIQDMFAEAGVEILSPKYVASRDGSASTIPPTIGGKPNPAAEQEEKPDKGENEKE